MTNPKILVSGATGKIGTQVVKQLLEINYPVRAMVHKLDTRSEQLKALGAEIIVADVFDTEAVYNAMKGTQRVFYLPVVHPYMIQSSVAFAVAAHQLQVEQIVTITQWLSSPSHPSLLTRHHWLTDHLMPMIPNVASTIVNPGVFADVYGQMITGASVLGTLPNFFGDRKNAPATNEDMARVAVATLLDPAKHNGKTYRPTSSEALSIDEMAERLGKILGRKIKTQTMPTKMFGKVAKSMGINPYEVFITLNYLEDGLKGSFEVNAPSNAVFELTGKQPESFETMAKRWIAAPEAQPTFSNKLKAIWDFIKIITTTPYNIEKYQKQMNFPMLSNPQLAADNAIWKQEHYTTK